MDQTEVNINDIFLTLEGYVSTEKGQALLAKLHSHIRDLESRLQWVSVKERLPEESGDYLVLAKYGMEVMEFITDGEYEPWKPGFYNSECCWQEVTHWMPLPAPPKEISNENQ